MNAREAIAAATAAGATTILTYGGSVPLADWLPEKHHELYRDYYESTGWEFSADGAIRTPRGFILGQPDSRGVFRTQ